MPFTDIANEAMTVQVFGMRNLSLFVALGLLSNTAVAAAEPLAKPKWVVDYAASFCILSRDLAVGQPGVAFRTRPLTDEHDLLIMLPPTGEPDSGAKGRLTSGTWVGEERWISIGEPAGKGQKYLDTHISAADLANVAAAGNMKLTIPRKLELTVPLGGIGKALAALRTCEDDLARKWQAENGWVVPPKLKDGWWRLFSQADYPGWASDRRKEGKVRALLTINIAGRISDCTIIESSGFAAFDKRTCEIFRNRARFSPALDVNRKPMPSKLMSPTVNYYLMK